MKKYLNQLSKCVLFTGLSEEEILYILKEINYKILSYSKGNVIAIEGSKCNSLGIILKGSVEVQKIFPSGQVTTINNFKEGNVFGESLVFTEKHTYPATISAIEDTEIMFIERENIIKLAMLNKTVLTNFVRLLSHRILMLNERISNLSQDSIRKKIANFLLSEYRKQQNPIISVPYSRKKMAELLNVPRPSLSRELVNMKEDNLIDFDKNTIKIVNLDELENTLFE